MCGCLSRELPGDPACNPFALTGDRTRNSFLLRPVLNPLSYASQGSSYTLIRGSLFQGLV